MKPKLFALALIFCFALGGKALAFNFTDVWPGSYCFEAVVWAVENGITNGTGNGTFAPNNPCTQGQFLLFLWRANGAPEPGIANPFNNSISGTYYKPALWGYQQGVVSGYSFNPNAECNLGMLLTSLWLTEGRPGTDALTWAVENGLNKGAGISTFSANHICSRGQVMVLLYNLHNLSGNNRRADEPYYNGYDNNYDDDDLNVRTSLSKSASIAGSVYNIRFSLSAFAAGGAGDYSYRFELMQNGRVVEDTGWTHNNGVSSSLSGSGSCEVRVTVRDGDGDKVRTVVDLLEKGASSSRPVYDYDDDWDDDYEDDDNDDDWEDDNDNNNSGNRDLRVDVAGLSKAASIAGNSYSMEFSLSAAASGGSGDYEYFFEVIQNGEVTNASDDWGVENAIRTRISGVGSCEVRITVRDSSGKTASTVVDLLERSDSSSFGSSISSGFWGTGRR